MIQKSLYGETSMSRVWSVSMVSFLDHTHPVSFSCDKFEKLYQKEVLVDNNNANDWWVIYKGVVFHNSPYRSYNENWKCNIVKPINKGGITPNVFADREFHLPRPSNTTRCSWCTTLQDLSQACIPKTQQACQIIIRQQLLRALGTKEINNPVVMTHKVKWKSYRRWLDGRCIPVFRWFRQEGRRWRYALVRCDGTYARHHVFIIEL
jgi:hypothetical protein